MATAPLVTLPPPTQVAEINQNPRRIHIDQPHGTDVEDGKRLPNYNSKAAVSTGIIQIWCGFLAFVLEVIYLVNLDRFRPWDKSATGIWGGLLFSITGVIGIHSAKKRRGTVIHYSVLSILSSVTASFGLMLAGNRIRYQSVLRGWDEDNVLLVSILRVSVDAIEGITATMASCFGCAAGTCCGRQHVIHERVIYMAPPQDPTDADDGFHYPMELPPSYESNPPVGEKH